MGCCIKIKYLPSTNPFLLINHSLLNPNKLSNHTANTHSNPHSSFLLENVKYIVSNLNYLLINNFFIIIYGDLHIQEIIKTI